MRIVVVGGGITGALTAYFLVRLGADVTLVERDRIGGQASGHNPGGLNPLHGAGIPGPLEELALASFRLHHEHWEHVQRLSRIDFEPRRRPRLHVAMDEGDVAGLERTREPYDATAGFAARWVPADEMRAIEPRLDDGVAGGLWTEGNAKVDAARYTRAAAKAAVELGARTLTGEVRGLDGPPGRVTGVRLDGGALRCDGVVLATGPWCAEPARWLGTTLPVEPLRGEMLLAELDTRGTEVDLAWREAAVYGTGGRRVWLGGTADRAGFDAAPSAAARASILERVSRILPGTGHARVVRQTAALRPVTPDGMPIVGRPAGWENACLALGSGRKGMLLSAGIGLAVAELLVRGDTTMPIGACAPERWAAPAPR